MILWMSTQILRRLLSIVTLESAEVARLLWGIAEHLGDTDTYNKLQVIKRYLPNPRVLAIMRGEAYL